LKAILRNGGVQAFLGWVLTGYLRLALTTIRWRHINVEAVEPVLAGESGAIALFWHGRIPLCLATAPQWWRKRTRAMISPSADGEFIAQALARVGFPAIRMSSAKPGDTAKARQAAIGFREAVTWTEGGGALVITPDGPRGPNEVIAAGALQIAKRSGAPVFLMGIAAAPALRMKTWDQVMWAAPFGRGVVVWDGPYTVARDIGPAEGEAVLADWSGRLSAVTRRAEAIARGEAD
jgi:lysophospholipid acyltransferase (LPLAT)-like uncharacterized protein